MTDTPRPKRMRLTPLDDHGRPSGPAIPVLSEDDAQAVADFQAALAAVPDDYTSVPHAGNVWIAGYLAGRQAERADATR